MSSIKYRPDIDGLRAVAVLAVLVFHFRLVGGGDAGFMGVDIFFVISGFLITSIVLKQLNAGSFSLPDFYLHRIRRLAPPLFVTLLLTVVAGYLIAFPADFTDIAIQSLWSQLYVANIYYWKSVNYFGLQSDSVFLLHTWSLAVEEQFYLFFPPLLIAIYRCNRRYVWVGLGLILVLSFLLNVLMVLSKPEATFYLLPTRAWELLIGSFTYLTSTRWLKSRFVDTVTGAVGALLIGMALGLFGKEIPFPGYFALLPCLGAACLIVSGTNDSAGVNRLLQVPPFVYVGRISYSLYLVHWPINIFASYLLKGDYSWAWRVGMFMFSVGLASVMYHFVESTFRERRIFDSKKSLLTAYVAGLCLSVIGFVSIIKSDGIPSRFSAEAVRLVNYSQDRPIVSPSCEFDPRVGASNTQYCRLGAMEAVPEWLIVGDSHAWAAYPAFDLWLKQRHQAALFSFRHACPPLIGIDMVGDQGACRQFNASVTRTLAANPTISSVFLVSTWRQANEAAISDSYHKTLSKQEALALFDRQFSATLAKYSESGKRVVIWEPLPGARQSVPKALARAVESGTGVNIGFDREEYEREFAFFFSALAKNSSMIAERFSPSHVLCDSGKCLVEIDGNPVYFDNSHLAASLSDFWAKELEKQLPH